MLKHEEMSGACEAKCEAINPVLRPTGNTSLAANSGILLYSIQMYLKKLFYQTSELLIRAIFLCE